MGPLKLSEAEAETLREAVLTWITLIANDQGDCGLDEALDITLQAGEILKITKDQMDEILERG